MKRVLIQAWDLAQENETHSLNATGDASPNQNWSAWTSKRKNEMITKFDMETSGICKFADTWERLFPTATEAGTMTAAGWSCLGKN